MGLTTKFLNVLKFMSRIVLCHEKKDDPIMLVLRRLSEAEVLPGGSEGSVEEGETPAAAAACGSCSGAASSSSLLELGNKTRSK